MDRLEASIAAVDAAFTRILERVQQNVEAVADSQTQASQRSLEDARDTGLHAQAESMRQRLTAAIARDTEFTRQLEQLEQVYLISEELKDAVRALEKTYR